VIRVLMSVQGLTSYFEMAAPVPAPRLPPRSPKVVPRSPLASIGSASGSTTSRDRTASPVPTVGSADSEETGEKFGSCLQACYEAINKRHDDEIRALESLRVHIFNRAKADREYAETLSKINNRANRGLTNVNQSSAIVQVSLRICLRWHPHSKKKG